MTQDSYRRRPGHVLVNLVEAGRDLVHGAAGTRPGSRRRRSLGGISQVGRWVGEGIHWLLEEDPGDVVQEEASWRESRSPMQGRSSRANRTAHETSVAVAPGSSQGHDGARRRPLQVIPHPAPPLLQQAEPSRDPWPEPSSPTEPGSAFSSQDPSGSPRRDGVGGRSRPRPRSSRRIEPWGQDS